MNDELQQVGRLAFRHEGEWWNAYYAKPNTMDGALLIGSIRIGAAHEPGVKRSFMDTMRLVVSNLFDANFGARPTWKEPQSAPEHERGGHA